MGDTLSYLDNLIIGLVPRAFPFFKEKPWKRRLDKV